MAYPTFVTRLANYLRDFLAGILYPDAGKIDSEFNLVMQSLNEVNHAVRGITNADGTLKNLATATAQALAGAEQFTATASQTVFLTTIPWVSAFTTSNVLVTSQGLKLNTALVSVADSGGFLQVTIPAQTVGSIVFVAAFESGAGILTRLMSTATGEGTSLIGSEDAGGYYVGVDQETINQEIGALMASLASTLSTLGANAILKNGSVTFTGNQPMGGFKITGLGAGTASSNDAARMADITSAALQAILGTYLSSSFLSLGGGTLTGDIDMGGNSIINMADGVNAQDAVTKAQLDLKVSKAGDTMTGDLVMDGVHKFTGLPTATAASDAVPLSQAQALAAPFSSTSAVQIPGTSSFIVPAGITKIKGRVWGAGGGGSSSGGGDQRLGGGGGAYAEGTITVTPGESLTIRVGTGGTGGAAPTDGGLSSIERGVTVLLGGAGGQDGFSGGGAGAGGTPTVDASVSGFGFPGGNADYLVDEGGEFMSGNGGDSPMGGMGGSGPRWGGSAAVKPPTNGVAPGGGGGSLTGNGATGAVVIYY